MKARVWMTAGCLMAGVMASFGEPEGKKDGGAEAGEEKEEAAEWVSLVPKEGMGKWKALNFGGEGQTIWENGVLTIEMGAILSGVVWTGDLPEAPYEIELEGRRMSGVDFFCALTFPVRGKKTCVSFIAGGWGGGVTGISSIDGMDASENETAGVMNFEDERWYKIRIEVRENSLKAWIDKKQMLDVDTTDRKLGMRFGDIEKCMPLGVATYQTSAELKNLRWRKLGE